MASASSSYNGLNPIFPIPPKKQSEPIAAELAERIKVVTNSFREEVPTDVTWSEGRALLNLISNESTTANENKHLQRAVSRWVSSILTRSSFSPDPNLNSEIRGLASTFLLDVIEVAIKTISLQSHRMADACNRILSNRFPFYLGYFLIKPEDRQSNPILTKPEERDKAKLVDTLHSSGAGKTVEQRAARYGLLSKQQMADISPYYLLQVNFFYQVGGLEAVIEIFSQRTTEPPLKFLKDMAESVSNPRDYLCEEIIQTFAAKLSEVIFDHLLWRSRDSFSQKEMAFFQAIASAAQNLMRLVDPAGVTNRIYLFNLDVHLKGFSADNLERNLRGVRNIRRLVEEARQGREEKRMINRLMAFTRATEEENHTKIDARLLFDWLCENKVLEQLFQPNQHPEMVRQGVDIPVFMAQMGYFQTTHVDMLWATAVGKHESVRNVIYSAFNQLIDCLTLNDLDHLYQLIKGIPLETMDLEDLAFIFVFSSKAMVRTNGAQPYGLDIFWNLMQDGTKVTNPRIRTDAYGRLLDLLRLPAYSSPRPFYAEQCVEKFAASQTVEFSLRLLMALIELKSRPREKRRMIDQLDQRYHFLDIFLQDLTKYVKYFSKNRKSPAMRPQLIAGFTTRFDFLLALVAAGELKFNPAQTEELWNTLTRSSRTRDLFPIFLQYLDRLENAFNVDSLRVIFLTSMATMDLSIKAQNQHPIAFEVYRKYFYLYNAQTQALRMLPNNKPLALVEDLDGINLFWDLLVQHDNPSLHELVIQTFNALYQNSVSDSMKPRLGQVRKEYIDRCMAILANPQTSPAASLRILNLLKNFVETFSASPLSEIAPTSSNTITALDILVEVKPLGPNLEIRMNSTDTIFDLKQEIAYRAAQTVERVRIAFAGTNTALHDDENRRQLGETKLLEVPQILADFRGEANPDRMDSRIDDLSIRSAVMELMSFMLRATGSLGMEPRRIKSRRFSRNFDFDKDDILPGLEDQAASKRATSPYHPAQLLADLEHFHRLYALLDHPDPSIPRSVWELLDILPNNDELNARLRTSPSLADVGSQNIFKLAYTLQMLLHIVVQGQLDIQENPSPNHWFQTWSSNFASQGGPAQLLSAFTGIPIPTQCSHGYVAANSIVLQLINHFVTQATMSKNSRGRREERYALKDTFQLPPNCSTVDLAQRLMSTIDVGSHAAENLAGAGNMVRQASRLLRALVDSQPLLLQTLFYQNDGLEPWLSSLMLQCPNTSVRTEASRCLASIVTEITDPAVISELPEPLTQRLSTLLLRFLPEISKFSATCGQYFSLLDSLLRDLRPSKKERRRVPDQWQELAAMLINQLKDHQVGELGLSCTGTLRATVEDKVLIGILNLLRTIYSKYAVLKADSQSLINMLFEECLFAMPSREIHDSAAPPKCKTEEARASAYRLIVELTVGSAANFSHVLGILQTQMDHIRGLNGQGWIPRLEPPRSATGYIGLQNQGATCYMNSLMQQLFHIPPFRQGILSITDTHPDKHDSLLFHIQYMFTFLSESLLQYCETTAFCRTIKDEDGRPVNTRVQMDANEYFNKLVDRLEGLLGGTTQNRLLQTVFQGELANQLLPRGCSHGSERDEPFYVLSVDVRNKKSLQEALEFFVEGETLSGENAWSCDECGEKRDTIKRCCIKTLPPFLFIQLKRFDFDYNEMRLLKNNDHIEFPLQINLEAFTREGLLKRDGESETDPLRASGALSVSYDKPDEYYQYYLCGVVVHAGSANSGHYYSFIKSRQSDQQPDQPSPWFEFNDTRVSPFDLSRLERECFGGTEDFSIFDRELGRTVEKTRVRANSAYMLVYERKQLPTQTASSAELVPPSSSSALSPQPVPSSTASPRDIERSSSPASLPEVISPTPTCSSKLEGETSPTAPTPVSASQTPPSENAKLGDSQPSPSSHGSRSKRKSKSSSSKQGSASPTPSESQSTPEPDPATVTDPVSASGGSESAPDAPQSFSSPSSPDPTAAATSPVHVITGPNSPAPPKPTVVVHLSPQDMSNAVWNENRKFIQKHHIYSPEYFQFVWSFLSLSHQDPEAYSTSEFDSSLRVIEFTTNFFFDVFARAESRSNFERWSNYLINIYTHNKSAAKWLIRSFCTRTREFSKLFTECPSPRVREAFAQIILKIFQLLAPEERQFYMTEHTALSNKNLTDRFNRKHKPVSYVIWFFDTLLYLLTSNNLSRSSSSTAEFFSILLMFAQLGPIELEWVIRENLVSLLVDYFLEQGPFASSFSASAAPSSAGGAHAKPSVFDLPFMVSSTPCSHLNYLIEFIAYVVKHCKVGQADRSPPPTLVLQEDGRSFQLPASDEAKLIHQSSAAFYERSIGIRVAPTHLNTIMTHLCWENRARSQYFLNSIRAGMSKTGNIMPFLNAMSHLQDITDSLQKWRVDASMIKSAIVVKDKAFNNDIRKNLRKWLVDRQTENQYIREWTEVNDKWVISDLIEAFQHVDPPPQSFQHSGAPSRSNLGSRVFSAVAGVRR